MIDDINMMDAIHSLKPKAEFVIRGNIIEWLDNRTQPTELEIANEVTRLQAEYDSLEYSRLRKAEYDKLNQDEMRYDDLKNNTNTWELAIDAIKLEYPKETI